MYLLFAACNWFSAAACCNFAESTSTFNCSTTPFNLSISASAVLSCFLKSAICARASSYFFRKSSYFDLSIYGPLLGFFFLINSSTLTSTAFFNSSSLYFGFYT